MLYGYCDAVAVRDTIPRYWTTKICRRNRLLYCRGMNRLGRRWPINSLCRRWLFVLRQNLLNIPFWGWGLRYMSPIAINRESGREALRKNKKTRAATLARRFCCCCLSRRHADGAEMNAVIIIPAALGSPNRRAWPIVPVSVNSGRCWPKGSFFKRSGLITVNIGPAFSATSMTISEINHKAQDWIEQSAIA